MKEIKMSKDGQFMCSHCRAAPKNGFYSRRWKWKTERGFQGHSCYKDEQEALLHRDEEIKKRDSEKLSEWEKIAKYKVGERVHYYNYVVTKPTHVQRGSRMVKVRYEEERMYRACDGIISQLLPMGYLINGHFVREQSIACESEVKEMAQIEQKAYDDHVEFSRFCR